MRLRSKLMLAMLATGLASVAMVGGLALVSVNYKVDSLRRQQASEHFHHFMTGYFEKYGDWETATRSESFDHFVRTSEREVQGEKPSEMLDRMPPSIDMRSRQGPGEYGPPPPPPGEGERPPHEGYGPPPDRPPPQGGYGPPQDRPPPQGGYGQPQDRPPPQGGYGPPPERQPPQGVSGQPQLGYGRPQSPGQGARPGPENAGDPRRGPPPGGRGDGPPGRNGPPFRFVLTDANYNILLGAGQLGLDTVLPEKYRSTARPIEVKGRTVAYMSAEGTLAPSKQELEYIEAMRQSLLAGVAAATALAIALGLLLSRGLSRSLGGLTRAVQAMHGGELRQQVTVKGKDEVAELANAFNAMSEQLAQKHEELNASHQTILHQAEQLRELSIRDALTQLYNRRHFDEQATTLFNQAVRHKRPLTLVICDIDHFKKINDTYSHATGDVVLRHVGQILRSHMRMSDLVARYGGEEFVMAFPETPGQHAATLCDKLRGLIESYPWHEVHPELKVTMSMGVCADVAAGSAETMLQKADALLYRAKETGRNRVCFA